MVVLGLRKRSVELLLVLLVLTFSGRALAAVTYPFTSRYVGGFDENGIPVSEVFGYHPGDIAREALMRFQQYKKTNDTSVLNGGLRMADWLSDNLECKINPNTGKKFGVWLHTYPHPPYTSDYQWTSAMSNGIALAALTVYAPFTQKSSYQERIACALEAFRVDVADGGVLTSVGEGSHWYEEQTVSARPMTLNGMIFALAGLWVVDHDGGGVGDLFQKGVAAVLSLLPAYDLGYHSRYSFMPTETGFPRPAHKNYNTIHVNQLAWLYCVTGEEKFLDYAVKFEQYKPSRFTNLKINGKVSTSNAIFDNAKFFGGLKVAAENVFEVGPLPEAPRSLRLFMSAAEVPEVSLESEGSYLSLGVPYAIQNYETDLINTTIFTYKIHPGFNYGESLKIRVKASSAYTLRQLEIDYNSSALVKELIDDYVRRGAWTCTSGPP